MLQTYHPHFRGGVGCRVLLPIDDMLKVRVQKLKSRREALLIEVAGTRRMKELPAAMLSAKQLDSFSAALRVRVLDRSAGFSKRYLHEFVSEIRFDRKQNNWGQTQCCSLNDRHPIEPPIHRLTAFFGRKLLDPPFDHTRVTAAFATGVDCSCQLIDQACPPRYQALRGK